jgi:hypothetical protein
MTRLFTAQFAFLAAFAALVASCVWIAYRDGGAERGSWGPPLKKARSRRGAAVAAEPPGKN